MNHNHTEPQLTRNEMLQKLQEAQDLMFEAYDLLEEVIDDAWDMNAKAYLLDHFKIMISDDHGFLSNDISVSTIMERVEKEYTCAGDCEVAE